jgi:hypothetical protein
MRVLSLNKGYCRVVKVSYAVATLLAIYVYLNIHMSSFQEK